MNTGVRDRFAVRTLALLVAIALLGALLLPGAAAACEECKFKLFLGNTCWFVGINEIGYTICRDSPPPCREFGSFCEVIVVY